MCFSAKISILTFIIGFVSSFLCFTLGKIIDKIVGLFFAFISLMQIIEYLLWNHQICDNYNRLVSICGMILNNMQPIVLGIIILLINTSLKKRWLIKLIIIIYLFFIVPYSIQFINNKDIQCTIKNKKHLEWKWSSMKYYTLIYFIYILTLSLIFIVGLPTIKLGIFASLYAVFTYLTSSYFYSDGSIGALWCFYILLTPLIYYFLRISGFLQ